MGITTERPSLVEIREKLGELKGALEKREFLKCSTLPSGIPRGVISEITGAARTEWIIALLRENPELRTFWVEKEISINPTAIHQRGAKLSHILFASAGDKLFQTLRKGLRSKVFECIVLPGVITEVKMLKALQLFARESNACVFFLSKCPRNAWAIPFQVRVDLKEDKSFAVEVLKSKFSHAESS